ncbi:MAG: hypothetical protein ACXADB_00560 [Candidatus Hermodarchaeia archaeon]|jgi:hypothetical protein
MPPNWKTVYGMPFDEEKWKEAKKRAAEEGHEDDWPYVVGIYKRMARTGEYKTQFSREREKKGQKVATWKEKNPKWQKKAHKVGATTKSMRLVVTHDASLEQFRCGACGALLFKGLHLEKSFIEVKCRSCGILLVSDALLMLE